MKTHKTDRYYTLASFCHVVITSASRGKEIENTVMYRGTRYKIKL